MITLRENEKLIKTVRQHRSVVAGPITWSVLLAGLVSWAFLKFKLDVFGYSWEIVTGAILIAALIILYKFYIWRKKALIVTNQRVLLNIRHGAFSQPVTELIYRDIYDISFKQVGFSALIKRDNASLEGYIKNFKNPEFLEKEARLRLNYKASGEEVVFVHRDINSQKASSSGTGPSQRTEEPPNYKKWWHWLLGF